MKDKNGKIYRRIPMHPVVKEAIQENRQQFIEQFGREPNSNDRVIFDKISQRRILSMKVISMLHILSAILKK